MSQQSRTVQRANLLLAAELGSLDGHHQAFKWCWSEELYSLIPCENSNGEPVYDFWCMCGKNIQIHQPACPNIVKATVRFEKFKVAPDIRNRWTLCRWIPPPPEDQWKLTFGTIDDYPAHGTYVPLAADNNRIILDPEILPNEFLSWKVIHVVRAEKTMGQLRAEFEKAQAEKEDQALFDAHGNLVYRPPQSSTGWWNARNMLKDQMITYPGHRPGTRSAGVSYPSVNPERN